MVNKILKFVKENRILENGDSVVLGVSGGADSICMLYILNELKCEMNLTLTAVHVNHHIRGEEADEDMNYVVSRCEKLGVPLEVFHIFVKDEARKRGMTEEEAGRACRYECFESICSKTGANKIAVAHNLNDNSETILFNLFRGTGVKGLSGIPVRRANVVRPLLCCTRDEIEMYLTANGIDYRNDSTNFQTEYSRNRLRLDVIPYIKENINSKAEYNIVNVGEELREIDSYLEEETQKAFKQMVIEKSGKENIGLLICDEAFALNEVILKRVVRVVINQLAGQLKDITRVHVNSVLALKDMNVSKKVNLPYNLVAVRRYDGIEIDRGDKSENPHMEPVILIENDVIRDTGDLVTIKLEKTSFSKESIEELLYTKWLDYDKIGTLSLRNRQEGDYLVIDDKGSKKKLKDYFINEKIPKEERDSILLLADGNHVVWVIGYRISSYYKVTEETENIVCVKYNLFS